MYKFNGANKTITGIKTKDVSFNTKSDMYHGSILINDVWKTNVWNKDGICQSSKYCEGNLLTFLN